MLMPLLPKELKARALKDAVAMITTIGSERGRVEALASLAPHLSEPLKSRMMEEAVAVTKAISFEEERLKAFASLASHLSPELLSQVLVSFQKIEDDADHASRAKAIMVLTPHLPEALKGEALEQAIATARVVKNEQFLARTLAVLAPHLSGALLARAH